MSSQTLDQASHASTFYVLHHNDINRKFQSNYMKTISIILYLLDECEKTINEFERIQYYERIFTVLNKNPIILIHNPKIRNVIIQKVIEIEANLNTNKIVNYKESIRTLKCEMPSIHNPIICEAINKHFNNISNLLFQYETWCNNSKLRTSIQNLYSTLIAIKNHPYYVTKHR